MKTPGPKVRTQTSLADQAYTLIEEMIVTLKLPPGHVFSESDLSIQTGIGRTPIREALQRLASGHLVATIPRRGVMVTEVNITEHLAILETRRVLDRLIAVKAARRASADQCDLIRELALAIRKAAGEEDIPEFMRLDREFDQQVGEASRNLYATRACAPLHAHCRRFWYLNRHNGDLTRSAALHGALMFAVADRNEAEAATCSDRLIDYLETFTRAELDLF